MAENTTRLLPLPDGPVRRVAELLAPMLDGMGYQLANVKLEAMGGKRRSLQIFAETREGQPVTLAQCEEISRAAAAMLDVEDVIKESYYLEVSSPGIDRELVRRKDWDYALGFEVKVKLRTARDGRANFRGRLASAGADAATLDVDGQNVTLPYSEMQKARVILTDELLEAKKVKHA